MNDINYIVNYLSMLKDDSISVSNLANEICTQICKDLGITRTDELEKTINGLLTRYKNGEINDNAIIQSFENVLNTSNVVQNNVSNSSYVNENISNVNNINKTFSKIKEEDVSKDNKENDKTPIIDDEVMEENEIKEDVSSSNVNTSFDNSNINGSISSTYTVVDKTVSNTDNSKKSLGEKVLAHVQEVSSNQGTNDSNAVVYDIDTDLISEIVNKCASVDSGISEASISVPGLVAKYASGVLAAAEGVKSIVSSLNGFKGILLGAIASAGESDIDCNVSETTWDDIQKLDVLSNRKGKKLADEKFFQELAEANKDCKVENGIVTIGKYQYNIKSKKLSWGDDKASSVRVEFYIPESITDIENKEERLKVLSKTNTVTMLAPSSAASMSSGYYFDEYSTNSIIIVPVKEDKKLSYTHAKQYMVDKVVDSTEFAKGFTKQDSGCKNYIMGCSNGGSSAFKIGASDTYDGVIVVNSVPLIEGVKTPTKEETMTDEELKSYANSGKPVLFISSAKDGDGDSVPNVDKGIKKMMSEYPGINVKWTTNNVDIDKSNSYVFNDEFWDSFVTNHGLGVSDKTDKLYAGQYTGHGSFYGLARDFINAGLLDGNEYNNGKTFEWK